MTERQEFLLDFLKARKSENRYISKFEISKACGYGWDSNSDRNGRVIEDDIRALNNDDELDCIIVSNKDGYKIGNEQEVNAYLKTIREKAINQLRKHSMLKHRAEKNGQYQLDTSAELEFKETVVQIFD